MEKTRNVRELLKEKKICEIINPKLVQGPPEMTLEQAIERMHENRSGYIVISKNSKAVGIFTENDFLYKVLGQNVDWGRPVTDFMTPNPCVLSPDDSVGAAMDLMADRRFYHLPLIDEKGDMNGILSVRTLIRFLAEFYPTEVYNLPPKTDQFSDTAEGG